MIGREWVEPFFVQIPLLASHSVFSGQQWSLSGQQTALKPMQHPSVPVSLYGQHVCSLGQEPLLSGHLISSGDI